MILHSISIDENLALSANRLGIIRARFTHHYLSNEHILREEKFFEKFNFVVSDQDCPELYNHVNVSLFRIVNLCFLWNFEPLDILYVAKWGNFFTQQPWLLLKQISEVFTVRANTLTNYTADF